MSGDKKDPGDPKDKQADSINAKNRPSGPPKDITDVPALILSGGHVPVLDNKTSLENPESTQAKPVETKK